MKNILFLFALFLVSTSWAYDINAIQKALSVNYNVEQGSLVLFNVSACEDLASCFGNNPESPYVQYFFPSWNNGGFGQLQSDQAILVIHARPPPCRYFGFTPYLYTRANKILFDSLSDTINMNVVNVSSDGTIALVSSPNPHVTGDIESILEDYLLPNAINTMALPGQLLNLGLTSSADTFGYLARYALFDNSTQGLAYLNNIPGYIFKLTPKTADTSALFPYPTFRPYGPTTNNENYLQTALDSLVAAVKASETGIPLVMQGTDVEKLIGYENGFTCINKSLTCNGDNRDARYFTNSGAYVSNDSRSHTWVVGVQHQTTGKAVYTAVAAYYQSKSLGVISVSDTKMTGSAQVFIPSNQYASNLYAIKFARSCSPSEHYCFVIPVNFPGVPLNETIMFTERVYVEPNYNVAPAAGTVLSPQFIRYRSLTP